ncbi:MAG: hypothetical protein KF905_05785 [Flavobacteriales bacterium]|nr:hypothetical protein [Flavobacteriales bacterium]
MVKVRVRWGRVLLASVGLLFCLAMSVVLIAGAAEKRSGDGFPYAVAAVLLLLCASAATYVRWQLVGRECIRMDADGLSYWTTGSPWSGRHVIKWHELERMEQAPDAAPMWWMEQWGLGGGRIVLHHSGRRTRFGMDLDPKEAAELLGRMQEEFIARRQATD